MHAAGIIAGDNVGLSGLTSPNHVIAGNQAYIHRVQIGAAKDQSRLAVRNGCFSVRTQADVVAQYNVAVRAGAGNSQPAAVVAGKDVSSLGRARTDEVISGIAGDQNAGRFLITGKRTVRQSHEPGHIHADVVAPYRIRAAVFQPNAIMTIAGNHIAVGLAQPANSVTAGAIDALDAAQIVRKQTHPIGLSAHVASSDDIVSGIRS